MLKAKLEKILNSKDVKNEIKNTKKAISQASHRNSLPKAGLTHNLPPSSNIRAVAKRFADELERLRVEADPAWETETPSGRLNIGRAMRRDINGLDRVFDKWEFNEDNTEIEAVVILDRSGSMYNMDKVCESAWAIKRAIERINGKVAIYSFNHTSRTLYKSNEKATHNVVRGLQNNGGTDPHQALLEAERVFLSTTAPTKLLFALTDGEWANDEACDSVIKRLNDYGVITSMVYLGSLSVAMTYEQWREERFRWIDVNDPEQMAKYELDTSETNYQEYKSHYDINRYKHGARYFRAIDKPTDLVNVARDITRSELKVVR